MWRRLATNDRPDLLKVGQRVVTDFPGYRMEGVIATLRPDSMCGSGMRASLERPEPCPMCSRETTIVKEYPQLFGLLSDAGVDAGWFQPVADESRGDQ